MSLSFEGEEVDALTIRVMQWSGPIPSPLIRGERVQLTVEVEVVGVTVSENQRNGHITREHKVKIREVKDMDIAP